MRAQVNTEWERGGVCSVCTCMPMRERPSQYPGAHNRWQQCHFVDCARASYVTHPAQLSHTPHNNRLLTTLSDAPFVSVNTSPARLSPTARLCVYNFFTRILRLALIDLLSAMRMCTKSHRESFAFAHCALSSRVSRYHSRKAFARRNTCDWRRRVNMRAIAK